MTGPVAIGDHTPMIIGVAGRNGAGKGEFVQFLETRSYSVFSLSDAIRKELADRGLEESRELMIETGQEMRRKAGPGALAQRLARQLLPDRNYAIDSIRHPVEVEILRQHAEATGHVFHLVWVDAKLETRFDRMVKRGRSGDPATIADLERLEGRERGVMTLTRSSSMRLKPKQIFVSRMTTPCKGFRIRSRPGSARTWLSIGRVGTTIL